MKKFYIFIIIIAVGLVGMVDGIFGKFWPVLSASAQVAEDVGTEDVIAQNARDLPDFFIKAVNPGYTVDGVNNVGEMIEIGRKNSDEMVSLAGLTLSYTNSSGKEVLLVDFSKYLWKTGETIILSLASSPSSGLAQVQYTKTLAFKAGPLALNWNGEVIDSVCWSGKDGCYPAFSSSHPTTLVRDILTGDFGQVSDYDFFSDGELAIEEIPEEADESREVIEATSQCKGVEFSEILSYYETLQSEQFVELHNNNSEAVRLDGCMMKYKNKFYPLSGVISADGYLVREATDFKLTKNPGTSNILELVDADDTVLDKLIYPNGQRKGTAYALIGYDSNGKEIWKTTYLPTPGEPNVYQEFRACEEGKVINEATGNCVKITSVSEKICPEGQYLNILTGRCRKNPTGATEKICKEGYALNPDTGRCRKITENTGADFALVPETYKEESSFVALYLVLGVLGVGLIYIGYEFRHEILKILRRVKWW